jgi:hypothetical protein
VASDSSSPTAAAAAAAAMCSGLPRSCWNLRSSGSYVHDPTCAEQLKGQFAKEEAAQLPPLQVGMLCLIIASVVITNFTGRRVGVGVLIWGGPLDTPATWHGCWICFSIARGADSAFRLPKSPATRSTDTTCAACCQGCSLHVWTPRHVLRLTLLAEPSALPNPCFACVNLISCR